MQLNARSLIFLIFLLSANTIGAFTTDVYLPALPVIADNLNTSNTLSQLTISIYFFSFSIAPLFFGPFSDSVGRKPIIVGALLLSIPATYLCYAASDINMLLLGRLVQGLSLGALISASRAIAPDVYKGKDLAKVMSILTMTMPLFLSVAPVIGGYVIHFYNWQAIFMLLICYLSVMSIYYMFVFENSNHDRHEHTFMSSVKSMGRLFNNKLFMLYGSYPVLTFIAISAYLTASPFLYQELIGLTPTRYGELALAIGVVIMIGGAINTRLLRHYSPHSLLKVSEFAIFISGMMLLICQLFSWVNFWTLFIPFNIFFIAVPFGFPNANSIAYTHIRGAFGAAGSLITFIQIFSGFVMSAIFSLLPADTYYPIAILFILCSLTGKLALRKAKQLEAE